MVKFAPTVSDNGVAHDDPRTPVTSSGLSFSGNASKSSGGPQSPAQRAARAEGHSLDVESFQGYRVALWKLPLAVLVLATSGGIVLFFRRRARLRVALCMQKCDLEAASYVLVTLTSHRQTLTKRKTYVLQTAVTVVQEGEDVQLAEGEPVCLINAFYSRFMYSTQLGTYTPVPPVPHELTAQLVSLATWLQERSKAAAVSDAPAEDLVKSFSRSDWDRQGRRSLYGRNQRRVLMAGVVEQILQQMFSPYCVYLYACLIFQVFFFQYYWWGVAIGSITVSMVCANVIQVYRNNRGFNALIHNVVDVELLHDGGSKTVKSTELVPGDVVVVKPGRLPCDMVLLWGRAIVDENMLTGEVVPIRKSPFLADHGRVAYRPNLHTACTLQGGTTVLQAWTPGHKEVALAMVCRTRFATAEGQLLAAVATPVANHDIQYLKDVCIYVTVATIIGFITLIPILARAEAFGYTPKDIGVTIANMMCIATPPAIPTCLAVATAFSIFRLYRRNILVSNADRINLAGHVSMVCLDKTGTITEAGMHFKGVIPVIENRIASLQVKEYEWSAPIRILLATCHGLIQLDDKLMGEDLDRQPFVAMNAKFMSEHLIALPSAQDGMVKHSLERAGYNANEHEVEDEQWYSLVRQFEFSSNRQRSVVVVQAMDSGEFTVNAKGSPEAILRLVDQQSVPANFDRVLDDFASQGFRMVAIATGRLPRSTTLEQVASLSQEDVEDTCNMRLLGLCVVSNKLHKESKGMLKRLHNRAQMRTAMVTGDHVLTGISVAKSCGMMYERRPVCVIDAVAKQRDGGIRITFTAVHTQPKHSAALPRERALRTMAAGECQCAITGPGFVEMLKANDRELIDVVLQNVTVAARMLPHHKQDLVALLGPGVEAGRYGREYIQGLGHFVGFCGDGLNDMAALRTAHVGVSLSAGDANVAAPFTARNHNIGSIAAMLAEGRCSLVITYYMFQYMIIYSIDELMLTNIMAVSQLAPSNNQYLLMDVLFVLIITILVALTGPEASLTREKPAPRLMSLANILPSTLQIVICTASQLGSIALLRAQPWYIPTDVNADPDLAGSCATPEVMTIFLISLGQLLVPVYILSRNMRPHTRPLRSNKALVMWLMGCFALVCYLIFETRPTVVTEYYCMVDMPMRFRGELFAYIVANFILGVLAQQALLHFMARFHLDREREEAQSGIWRTGSMSAQTARALLQARLARMKHKLSRQNSSSCGVLSKSFDSAAKFYAASKPLNGSKWKAGVAALIAAKHVGAGALPAVQDVHDIQITVADSAAPQGSAVSASSMQPLISSSAQLATAGSAGAQPSGIGRFRVDGSSHALPVRPPACSAAQTACDAGPSGFKSFSNGVFDEVARQDSGCEASTSSLTSQPLLSQKLESHTPHGRSEQRSRSEMPLLGTATSMKSPSAVGVMPAKSGIARSRSGDDPRQQAQRFSKSRSAKESSQHAPSAKPGRQSFLTHLTSLGKAITGLTPAPHAEVDAELDTKSEWSGDSPEELSRSPTGDARDANEAAAAFREACEGLPPGVDYFGVAYPASRRFTETSRSFKAGKGSADDRQASNAVGEGGESCQSCVRRAVWTGACSARSKEAGGCNKIWRHHAC